MNIIYYDTQRKWDRFVPDAQSWIPDIVRENDFFIVHDSDRRVAGWEFGERYRNVYCLVIDGGGRARVAGMNEGGYFHCCRVAVSRDLQEESRLIERLRSVIDYCSNNPGSDAPWYYLYEDTVDRLRQRLLTPLVLLHLGLQTVAQSKNDKLNKLAPEEIELCEKGVALLKNKTLEIEKTLCKLMGIPHLEKGNSLEPLNQLRKWLLENVEMLVRHFEHAKTSGQFPWLEREKLRSLLTTIEDLSQIVDQAVEYGERVKTNSALRHFLDNAIPRLSGYPEILNEEGCRSIERDLKGLDSTLASILAPDHDEFWTDDIKEAAKSALSMIGEIRKALQLGECGRGAFSQKRALLDGLDRVARLTLPRMPRPEAQ